MGCDIHLYTEKKSKFGDVEGWVNCDYWMLDDYYALVKINDEDNEDDEPFIVNPLYRGRHYLLFALLADVRNGYGEARIEPLSEPKGIPEDLCWLTKEVFDKWGNDGHSHSYFTYNEFIQLRREKNYPVEQYSGYVSPEDIERIESGLKKCPTDYVESNVAEQLKIKLIREGYQFMTWQTSVCDDVLDEFQKKIEKRMMEIFNQNKISDISKYGDDFRIVFFFDN